jgi:uncharacterized protein YndB with AHSA1/START domain
MSMPPPIKTTDLTVSRTIPATPAEIYDVWLDPKSPGGPWFGAAKAIVDAKVDGLFFHAMQHEGRTWAHYGRFVALDRPGRIEHTWMSEATRGLDTVVTVTLEPKDGATLVTIRHTGVPDDDMGRGHAEGWGWMLGMLEQKYGKKAR